MINIVLDNNQWLNILLNRPEKANAITAKMFDEMTNHMQSSGLKGVKFAANGKHFSAGADLTELGASARGEDDIITEKIYNFFKALSDLAVPTVAYCKGYSAGAGLGIIACCDLVIATRDSKFQSPEINRGIAPAIIAEHVIKKIGMHQAKLLFLTGREIDAEQAMKIGLIDAIESDVLSQILVQNSDSIPIIKSILKQDCNKLDALRSCISNSFDFSND